MKVPPKMEKEAPKKRGRKSDKSAEYHQKRQELLDRLKWEKDQIKFGQSVSKSRGLKSSSKLESNAESLSPKQSSKVIIIYYKQASILSIYASELTTELRDNKMEFQNLSLF